MKGGTRAGRLHDFFSGSQIVLEALVGSHVPQVMVVTKSSSFEEVPAVPFQKNTTALLEAAPDAFNLAVKPGLFELRVYRSRTPGAERTIFHRAGIFPLLQGTTLAGAGLPKLTYLIPFDSFAAREQAWAKFGADPEWAKARGDLKPEVSEIGIYQTAYWGKIFEMSL